MAKANMNPKKNPMPVQDPILRGHNFQEVALGYDEAISRGRMYADFERHAYEEACNLFKKEEN